MCAFFLLPDHEGPRRSLSSGNGGGSAILMVSTKLSMNLRVVFTVLTTDTRGIAETVNTAHRRVPQ